MMSTPTKLSVLCDFIRGVSFSSSDVTRIPREEAVPVLRAGNITGRNLVLDSDLVWVAEHLVSSDQILRQSDIVMCMSSGSSSIVGKAALLQQDWRGTVGAFCGIIRARDNCDPYWLAAWLNGPGFIEWRNQKAKGASIQNLQFSELADLEAAAPSISDQKVVALALRKKFGYLDDARRALVEQVGAAQNLPLALIRESMVAGGQEVRLEDVLGEITWGVGAEWKSRPLLGASRGGLSLAKEPIGKSPERYKPVQAGCIFYNPMRVLLGSIAFVEEGTGIVSPDYVAFTTKAGRLHSRWFYHWLRSELGEHFIKGFARGAVRERILFNRLVEGVVLIPSWEHQLKAVERMQGLPALNKGLADQLAALDLYPAALLRDAFAGRL